MQIAQVDRRLHARRRRPAAPRDGQEEARGDGEAPRHLRRRRREERPRAQGATQLFDLMEKFAGYGFNKSHAAAYALVAYQTAYFKAHHPAAFMAANLSLVMDDTDKVRALYDDTLDQGLAILPPDVNASAYRFEPVDATRIRYGLGAIKGTGEHAIEAIVAARDADGPFREPLRFLPPRRQARRQPPRGRGAGPGRRVRRDRAAACGAARLGGRCARRSRARARAGGAGLAVRRRCGRPTPPLVATRRLDRGRAARARKDGARLLPVRASVQRLRRRARAARAHAARRHRAARRALPDRRHRHRAAHADRAAAARWRSSRSTTARRRSRSSCSTRRSTRRAPPARGRAGRSPR